MRGPCIYLAYGRSTCAELASRVDTKVSHDDTVEWEESRWRGAGDGAGRSRNTRAMRKRWLVRGGGYPVAEHLPRVCACAGLSACRPRMLPRALARPTRTSGSGRVFGAHPRGEFRTSGAAVGQIGTRAASAAFLLERGGLSEQRGWAPKALRLYVRRLRLCATTSGTEGSAPRRLGTEGTAPQPSTKAAARAAKNTDS